MSRRYAHKIDRNQPEIIRALEQCGCVVFDLSGCGDGIPDLLACRARKQHYLEVKDPEQPPSARRLTPAQQKWHAKAKVAGLSVHVVETVAQAMAAVGLLGCQECAAGSLEHEARCGCRCHARNRSEG